MKENWVDYKEVKAAVSIEMALGHYGIRLQRVNKTSLRGRCPLPTHSSETSKLSFGVRSEKNAWACQSQSCVSARGGRRGGNVLDFVAVMESCTVRDAALKLRDWFLSNGSAATVPVAAELVAEETEHDGANKPLAFNLRGVVAAHPWIQSRGITKETAERFGAGFFPGKGLMTGRIVIPIHNAAGELVAYAGRATDDETEPRYRLPPGFNKTLEVYNLHRAREYDNRGVVIVEGFFDAMNVHQADFPAVVALMGSSLSEAQAEQIAAHFKRAIVMLDGDKAGDEATPGIVARLARSLDVRVAEVPRGRQPDNLSDDEIQGILINI